MIVSCCGERAMLLVALTPFNLHIVGAIKGIESKLQVLVDNNSQWNTEFYEKDTKKKILFMFAIITDQV